jgi:hypothetical protein
MAKGIGNPGIRGRRFRSLSVVGDARQGRTFTRTREPRVRRPVRDLDLDHLVGTTRRRLTGPRTAEFRSHDGTIHLDSARLEPRGVLVVKVEVTGDGPFLSALGSIEAEVSFMPGASRRRREVAASRHLCSDEDGVWAWHRATTDQRDEGLLSVSVLTRDRGAGAASTATARRAGRQYRAGHPPPIEWSSAWSGRRKRPQMSQGPAGVPPSLEAT